MSWAVGYDDNWKRDIGYGVPSICDHPGCPVEIDRGLSFVCGGETYGGEHGCGLYICGDHYEIAGDRRDNVRLCRRCYWNRGDLYTPTPDTPEWIHHKATDPSWAEWRAQKAKEATDG